MCSLTGESLIKDASLLYTISILTLLFVTHHIETYQLLPSTCFSFQILTSDVKDGIVIVAFQATFQATGQLKQILLLFVFGLWLVSNNN